MDPRSTCSACLLIAACVATHAGVPRSARAQEPPRPPGSQRLDTVRVKAERRPSSGYRSTRIRSATRVEESLRDLPQSVAVVQRAQIADQAMQSMSEVVRYVAGVSMAQGEGHRDAPVIRGIASTADFYVNGVRDDAQYLRDVYNLERVELLKGANALAFGRGGGGGVLNRVVREAQWGRSREVTLEGGSFAHSRGTFDIGDALSRRAAVRLTGVLQRSASYRDEVDVDRLGVNPTFAWMRGATSIRAAFEHFQDRRTTDRGIPSFRGAPLDGYTRTFFGDPAAHRARTVVNSAGVNVEHEAGDGVQVRALLNAASYDKDYQNTVPGAVSADRTTYALSAYRSAAMRHNLFGQTDIVARRRVLRADQTFVAALELGRQDTDNYRETGYFAGTAASRQVALSAPTVGLPIDFRQSATDADNTAIADIASGSVQHQAQLGRHIQSTFGVRWERFALRVANHRTDDVRRRTDAIVSPRAGLVIKPWEPVSFYGSYSTSALPSAGDQFSSLDATSETLAPERFRNREVGLKWDVTPTLAFTAAVYQLDRTNTRAADANVPGRIVQTGAQRSTGGEVGVTGNLTSRWQVSGSWASQRARVRRATTSAAQGATVPLVPGVALSLWNRLQLQRRVGVGVGIVHQGDVYAAIDNRVTLPAYTRWDGALYLALSRQLRVQANVENLLGAGYFATAHNNTNILPGSPRSLRLSVTATP